MNQQDIFLKVLGEKAGAITGESQDVKHKDEIDILGFTWGMLSKSNVGGGAATGRRQHRELVLTKGVDKASTALMGALAQNEVIKEAVLTVRKAGKHPLEYLKIKIQKGRIVNVSLRPDPADPSRLQEEISFSYQMITVEYTPQGPDGQPRGGTTFMDDWSVAT